MLSEDSDPIKQKAAEIGRACICFNMRKTTRAITAHYDRMISPSGLKATQLSLLMTVLLREKANLSQLANMLGMDRTTVSRNSRLLEQRGMISISSGEDRREQCIDLTDAGREAINLALPLWKKAQAEVVDRVGVQWAQEFLANLKQLNKTI